MKNKKTVSGKMMVVMMSLMLVVGLVTGGTIAWLTDKTQEVTNTFTYGDINIGLAENTGSNYEFVPGRTIEKDPYVTVEAGSEECYLFVKVTEENWPEEATYSVTGANDWIELEPNVYYQVVNAKNASEDVIIKVLANDQVKVSDSLTKEKSKNAPNATLKFKAYAVQKEGIDSAADAWEKIPAPEKQ